MLSHGRIVALSLVALVLPAATLLAANHRLLPGTWRKLPTAPFAVQQSLTGVWTGRQLLVFGRDSATNPSVDVSEAYNPAADAWTRLSPPPGPEFSPGYRALWTGKEMLVWGTFHSVAFNPATDSWRTLRRSLPTGIVVWNGREAIGWGGGCCGDAQSNGAAYNPATDTFHNLARSPLAPDQRAIGAWTGRELILFVSGINPADGKPWPARLARAAAYSPATNTWRRIAPLPVRGGTAVWDGRELLVVGGGASARASIAYDPTTNGWRPLAPLPSRRIGAAAVWSGNRLLLWGGQTGSSTALAEARSGLAYSPRTDRWSVLPRAPLRARSGSAVVWTGRALIIWGGEIGTPGGTSIPPKFPRDGAAFRPTSP